MFENNADLMDMIGDVVDLELIEKFKKAELLGRKIRIVEKRWRFLCDRGQSKTQQTAGCYGEPCHKTFA